MANLPRFPYEFARLEQPIEDLVGVGEVKERLDAASKTLAAITPENFP